MLEVPIRTQQNQVIPDAEPREERIDRTDLHAAATAGIAKLCRGDVILALRHDQWQRRETVEDLLSRLWTTEPLKELLEDQAGSED
jgi:hypothetical protein